MINEVELSFWLSGICSIAVIVIILLATFTTPSNGAPPDDDPATRDRHH